jgi:hypothetical protein
MKRDPVLSTSVKSMGWENNQLEVEYPNGSVYLYKDVPLEDFQNIRVSKSIGRTLKEKVVFVGKPYTKLNGPAGK